MQQSFTDPPREPSAYRPAHPHFLHRCHERTPDGIRDELLRHLIKNGTVAPANGGRISFSGEFFDAEYEIIAELNAEPPHELVTVMDK